MESLMHSRYLIILTAVLLASGCQGLDPERSLLGRNRVNVAAPNQMLDPSFEVYGNHELIMLLDPGGNSAAGKSRKDLGARELAAAFASANNQKSKARRSQVQDRLIAASNQRCNVYLTYLKRLSTYTNGTFGTLTTILGGAGAIVTSETAGHVLSGLAGIASGTRAELNQAIFESLATSVIVPAIQQRRQEVFDEIMGRRKWTLERYTVEGAVADAIAYHGACSIDAGIAHAQKSLQSFADIGVRRFAEVQEKFNEARLVHQSAGVLNLSDTVFAEEILDEARNRAGVLAEKIHGRDGKAAELRRQHGVLMDELSADALAAEAQRIDGDWAQAMKKIYATSGHERRRAYQELENQQARAEEFREGIDRRVDQLAAQVRLRTPGGQAADAGQ